MVTLAEILRRHWPAYWARFGTAIPPAHRAAVKAILTCRTPQRGGHLFVCDCGAMEFAYHSCGHRACHQCGKADAHTWAQRQEIQLLPVPYFLVTFTHEDRDTGQTRSLRLGGEEFLRRFLQHVLPTGFQRVRHFGWLSAAAKSRWERIHAWLDWKPAVPPPTDTPCRGPHCPRCQKPMRLLGPLARPPPWIR